MTTDQPRTDLDLAAARAALEAERDELVATLKEQLADAAPQESATTGIGETEHVFNSEQNELAQRVAAVTKATLDDVLAAIARLDDGTYGQCVECAGPIATERLQAIPAASHCVDCQSGRRSTSAFV